MRCLRRGRKLGDPSSPHPYLPLWGPGRGPKRSGQGRAVSSDLPSHCRIGISREFKEEKVKIDLHMQLIMIITHSWQDYRCVQVECRCSKNLKKWFKHSLNCRYRLDLQKTVLQHSVIQRLVVSFIKDLVDSTTSSHKMSSQSLTAINSPYFFSSSFMPPLASNLPK